MSLIIIVLTTFQSTAISLGMGASTLAILNFFVAIADGKIEPEERKMMGVVYTVLRIAMIVIALTTFCLAGGALLGIGIIGLSPFVVSQIIIIFVLFLNSFLMTKRIIPSSIGPAIQAGSWYSLGILSTLVGMLDVKITLGIFLLWYIIAIVTAVVLVNGMKKYLKK